MSQFEEQFNEAVERLAKSAQEEAIKAEQAQRMAMERFKDRVALLAVPWEDIGGLQWCWKDDIFTSKVVGIRNQQTPCAEFRFCNDTYTIFATPPFRSLEFVLMVGGIRSDSIIVSAESFFTVLAKMQKQLEMSNF